MRTLSIVPGKQLTRIGRPSSDEPVENADVAMAKSIQHAKGRGKRRGPKTPPPSKEPKMPVIGSSCTWREAELDHLKVDVLRDIDVRKLIPNEFFEFDHLRYYKECRLLRCID